MTAQHYSEHISHTESAESWQAAGSDVQKLWAAAWGQPNGASTAGVAHLAHSVGSGTSHPLLLREEWVKTIKGFEDALAGKWMHNAGLTVTGQPGIGKNECLYAILLWALERKQPVVWSGHTSSACTLFFDKGCFEVAWTDFDRLELKVPVLVLVRTDLETASTRPSADIIKRRKNTFTVLATSVDDKMWQGMERLLQGRFFVQKWWTWEEISAAITLRKSIFMEKDTRTDESEKKEVPGAKRVPLAGLQATHPSPADIPEKVVFCVYDDTCSRDGPEWDEEEVGPDSWWSEEELFNYLGPFPGVCLFPRPRTSDNVYVDVYGRLPTIDYRTAQEWEGATNKGFDSKQPDFARLYAIAPAPSSRQPSGSLRMVAHLLNPYLRRKLQFSMRLLPGQDPYRLFRPVQQDPLDALLARIPVWRG
ncbi:hypothetical protein JCM10207_006733 [Rhodosporidiobolus poonsookiae]